MTNIIQLDRSFRRRSRRPDGPSPTSGTAERARSATPREEPLRALSDGLVGAALTAWRGHSGRRYVVAVTPLAEDEIAHLVDAVVIAVARAPDGGALIVEVAAFGPSTPPCDGAAWLARMRARGATELHIHRLGAEDGRRAALQDLGGGPLPRQGGGASARPAERVSSDRLAAIPARIGSLTPISTSWACVERT